MPFVTRPAYEILTDRLRLRPWGPQDAAPATATIARSKEHLLPWLPWAKVEPSPIPMVVDRFRTFRAQFDLGTDFVLGIFDRETDEVVGGTGFHPRISPGAAEIGYWIDVDRVGRGLATEAIAGLTRVGLTALPYRKLEIRVHPENEPSARIPRRLGYHSDGRIRSHVPDPDPDVAWHDVDVFSLLRDELEGSEAARRSTGVEAFDATGAALPLALPGE
ncbi:MAG: GNAT family N-acetyltransferase [Planctomycetota bacterium]|jgi:RimJ/RimL family protein N-acetyltransferase